jgi:hypothetical protein
VIDNTIPDRQHDSESRAALCNNAISQLNSYRTNFISYYETTTVHEYMLIAFDILIYSATTLGLVLYTQTASKSPTIDSPRIEQHITTV